MYFKAHSQQTSGRDSFSDRAVDAAYGKTTFSTEAERVAFLFTLYEKLTSLFPSPQKPRRRPRKTSASGEGLTPTV